mmetsp:Transcript_29047/g.89891  ORF Transcript_29047/g.89891 Transcript_29047/m.89891 type:complete len:145 (-) Transcript_29047:21-455(-)
MDTDVFMKVLDGISDDGFLGFVDSFLDDSEIDWSPVKLGDRGFSQQHFAFHRDYCALYESRLRSVLQRHKVEEADFVSHCQVWLTAATNHGDAESTTASTRDVVETLVSMLEWVADFGTFASMMASRNEGSDGTSDTNSDPSES